MKVTTWNINGVKARIESALAYLRQASPDVICLQEIKSVTEAFPKEAFEDLGYQCAVHGQKGFNGVA
ncbi:MAG TPA: endonuclease/exonuclease/phosphatase family protein, partial [Hyphomicrobium sp.]|nr:endonuclease/exonuclease/phosphatase family protein [Hyphomicrobium sp.]